MPRSPDDHRDRRRRRSLSDSPERDTGRRRRDEHGSRSSRRHDEHRSSRRDMSRRRTPRSPTGQGSHGRDRDRDRDHRRERRRSDDADDDRRKDRRDEERSHRSRRDRGDDWDRRSRRKRSTSGYPARRRSRSPSSSRSMQRSKAPLPSQNEAFTSTALSRDGGESSAPPVEKQKPNFGNTGRLAAESNMVNIEGGGSVVLKYHEPPEARKPPAKEPWRLYVFKGDDLLELVELHERSCWLVGKERLVVDFPLDHPSCSKQHAAIQFRFVERRNEFGDRIGKVKPYLIDLESANGSSVNGEAVPAGRFLEIQDKDVLRFGLSTREYVMMLPPPELK